MFDSGHYVPLLRWKAGEQRALRELFDQDRRFVTPMIELPGRETMPEGKARRSLGAMLGNVPETVERVWGASRLFFDPASWSGDVRAESGGGSLAQMFAEASGRGLNIIPVTGLTRAISYQATLAKMLQTGVAEVCLRLGREDLEAADLGGSLDSLLRTLRVAKKRTHLVVDLQVVGPDEQMGAVAEAVPFTTDWGTLTVIGGSFPKDLTGFRPGQHVLPRREWNAWRAIRRRSSRRVPTFGDYATLNPELSRYVRGMNISASIRYTADDYWVIMRGQGLMNDDGPGHAQYPANAELLTRRPEFCGRAFSFGDGYVAEIGLGKKKTGNPTTWLQAAVNHHITFVVRQLAS